MKSIVILDFGSVFVEDIKRVLNRWFITSYILPFDVSLEEILDIRPSGIILSGSPDRLSENLRYEKEERETFKSIPLHGVPARRPHPGVYSLGIPILGICYGHQLIAEHYGIKIQAIPNKNRSIGIYDVHVIEESPIFEGLSTVFPAFFANNDYVPEAPAGFTVLARSQDVPVAAMQKDDIFGVQFHPEADKDGVSVQVLKNFVEYAFQTKSYDE